MLLTGSSSVIFNKELKSIIDIKVYLLIFTCSDGSSYCWPTNKHLAHICNCDERTIMRSLDKLEQLQIITRIVTKTNAGSKRRIYPRYVDDCEKDSIIAEIERNFSSKLPRDIHVTNNTSKQPRDMDVTPIDFIDNSIKSNAISVLEFNKKSITGASLNMDKNIIPILESRILANPKLKRLHHKTHYIATTFIKRISDNKPNNLNEFFLRFDAYTKNCK